MYSFEFESVMDEASAVAAGAAGKRFIAGGTTLVDLMRDEVEQPASLVDINGLPLRDIATGGGGVVIGALARMAQVAEHDGVTAYQPLLGQALLEGASPQLRNMASIGGNLLQRVRCPYFRQLDAPCNKRMPGSGCSAIEGLQTNHAILGTSEHCIAAHPSDLAVALVALDGSMRVHGASGRREFPVESLYRLPGSTPQREHTLRAGELITHVRVPRNVYGRATAYLKVRDRSSYEFALVSVAAAVQVSAGTIRSVRLAAGGVGTRPWRLRACEVALLDKPFTRDALDAAARHATATAKLLPGTAYKAELLRRTVVRALETAGDNA